MHLGHALAVPLVTAGTARCANRSSLARDQLKATSEYKLECIFDPC
jgi:hypothetical protein